MGPRDSTGGGHRSCRGQRRHCFVIGVGGGVRSGLPGVAAVSISWGDSPEFAGETAYDADFTTPSGHQGVTFVAASGDNAQPNYPSTSSNVLAVAEPRWS